MYILGGIGFSCTFASAAGKAREYIWNIQEGDKINGKLLIPHKHIDKLLKPHTHIV
jgi:hypothetical protein